MKFFGKKDEPIVKKTKQLVRKYWALNNPTVPKQVPLVHAARPDTVIRDKKLGMVALCRQEAAQDGYAAGFVRQMQDSVVGSKGLSLQSLHSNEKSPRLPGI